MQPRTIKYRYNSKKLLRTLIEHS